MFLLPHMMPGSRMPKMINIEPYKFPTKAALAMTGQHPDTSTDCRHMPTIRRQFEDTPLVQVCVPKRLMETSFIGNSKPLKGNLWELNKVLDPSNDLSLITAPFCKGGTVWAQNTALASHLFNNPNDGGPLPDLLNPHWSLIDNLNPVAASTYWYH